MTNTLAATTALLLSGYFQPEVRSSYLTRGRVLEDRPVQANKLRIDAKLGADAQFGQVGFWYFGYSALTDRNADKRKKFLFENCYGIPCHYDLKLTDGLTLANEFMPCWITLREYPSKTELWFIQSLRSKWVVPFWWMRCGVQNGDFLYVQLGLRKSINLGKGFSLTPMVATGLGNADHMSSQYAVPASEASAGVRDVLMRQELDYRICRNLSVWLAVEQYDVLDSTIRRAAAEKTPADLTILSAGFHCSF